MNQKMYKKVNDKVAEKFKDAAAWIVDNQCTELDKSPIIGTHRTDLIETYSYDLALGSIITNNKYLLIGGLTGAIVFSIVGMFVGYKCGERHTLNELKKEIESPEFKKQFSDALDEMKKRYVI